MGLRDILTGRHAVKGPAPDRLFAISTAYVTLEAEHQIKPAGKAAIVFQALATSEFEATLRDMEEVVKATGGESGTSVATQDDSYGYRWMVLSQRGDPSVEDLAVGINAVSGLDRDRGPRRAAALRGVRLRGRGRAGDLLHLQLQARLLVPVRARTPTTAQERQTERELQLKAQMGAEMPIEPELERWFPLWGIPI